MEKHSGGSNGTLENRPPFLIIYFRSSSQIELNKGAKSNRLSVCVSVVQEDEPGGDEVAEPDHELKVEEEVSAINGVEVDDVAEDVGGDGVDWESACYEVDEIKFADGCDDDENEVEAGEAAALDLNERFIAVQYLADSHIDVFDRSFE